MDKQLIRLKTENLSNKPAKVIVGFYKNSVRQPIFVNPRQGRTNELKYVCFSRSFLYISTGLKKYNINFTALSILLYAKERQ